MDIEKAKKLMKFYIENYNDTMYELFKIVLLELEKKDKVINEMAEEIALITGSCPYDKYDYALDCSLRCEEGIEAECWKEYFTNKAENVGE